MFTSANLIAQEINPDNKNIHVHGANFVKMIDGKLVMHRHSDEIYENTTPKLRFSPEKAKSGSEISRIKCLSKSSA